MNHVGFDGEVVQTHVAKLSTLIGVSLKFKAFSNNFGCLNNVSNVMKGIKS